jgi:opacity protein-like surface antigen
MTLIVACVAGLAMTGTAAAQSANREGSWETSVGIVFTNSSDADFQRGTHAEFESDTGFRLAFDYHYTDKLQFGASIGLGQSDYEVDIGSTEDPPLPPFQARGDLEYWTLMANAAYNFMDGPFSPFVTAGLGWAWVDTNIPNGPPEGFCWWDPWFGEVCTVWQDTRSLDGFTYQLGVGARYDFSDTLAVHASYRMDWIDLSQAKGTPEFDGFELSVGWKF